jgi:hypothetical protein
LRRIGLHKPILDNFRVADDRPLERDKRFPI